MSSEPRSIEFCRFLRHCYKQNCINILLELVKLGPSGLASSILSTDLAQCCCRNFLQIIYSWNSTASFLKIFKGFWIQQGSTSCTIYSTSEKGKNIRKIKFAFYSMRFRPFIIRERYKQFLQQFLMSCGGHSGPAPGEAKGVEVGQIDLIAGCFAFNHSPDSLLQLTLRKDAILISCPIPTNFSHPTTFPVNSQLAYRITTPPRNGSQNPFWLLQLQDGITELKLRSEQFDSLDVWRCLLKKHVNKFGFWEDFKPIRRISKGTGSAVYEVVRLEDGKRFAVKAFPKAQFQQNQHLFLGMHKEIRVLRDVEELRHNHLLGVEEIYDSESSYYLIMELCGKDLMKLLCRVGAAKMAEKVRDFMWQLLTGLAALHKRGVIHRDIKPNNIMLRGNGKLELTITDFGLATFLGEDHPFVRCGTPGFVAPEVFELKAEEKLNNFASDIFSMGAVFHLLLTGQPLFTANTPNELFIKNSKMDFNFPNAINEQTDSSAVDLLQKMLVIDPNERITAEQALKHQYFFNPQAKLRSPAPTFQSYNVLVSNQQQFSEIDIGIMGRKRHKGEYRKASEQ